MSRTRTASRTWSGSADLTYCARGLGERPQLLEDLGRRTDVGVLRRHVEEVHRVGRGAAIVHRVVRHERAEVVGEAVDHAAAHAAAGGAAGDDERVGAEVDEMA